ncbi:MAG: extracellular solute-binding protein [Oscillospiraceae bacterium]|nr:extracellular solute-binding protein [Oscillospiraceae bacterium]
MLIKKFIFAVAIVCAIFTVSCGEPNKQNGDGDSVSKSGDADPEEKSETGEIADARVLPDLPEENYGGYTFTWLAFDYGVSHPGSVTQFPRELVAEEESGEVINDSTYRRNSVIIDKYGVEFEMVTTTNEKNTLNKSVKAGDDLYDAAMIFNHNAPSVMSADLLLDTSKLTYVNWDKPWWDSSIRAISMVGKNFFLAGDIMILDKEAINVLFFNKKLMADSSMELPYQSVLDGKWTLDKFNGYIKDFARDLNGDGVIGKGDMLGLYIMSDTFHAFYVSGGGLLAKNDNNGIPQPTFSSEQSILVMDKIADVLYGKEYVTNFHTNQWGSEWDMYASFAEGRMLTMWGRLYVLDSLRNMDDDFGILPLPKYSEAQEKYHTDVNSYSGYMIAIPKTSSNPERTSVILEALAAESRYTLLPAYYDITLQRKYTRDEESGAMLDILFTTTVYDSGSAYDFAGIWGEMSGLCSREDSNFASWCEKHEPKVSQAIDKMVAQVEAME